MRATVLVETMPDYLRESHRKAGNWGKWPVNGSERSRLPLDAADALVAAEPEYDHLVSGSIVLEIEPEEDGDLIAKAALTLAVQRGEPIALSRNHRAALRALQRASFQCSARGHRWYVTETTEEVSGEWFGGFQWRVIAPSVAENSRPRIALVFRRNRGDYTDCSNAPTPDEIVLWCDGRATAQWYRGENVPPVEFTGDTLAKLLEFLPGVRVGDGSGLLENCPPTRRDGCAEEPEPTEKDATGEFAAEVEAAVELAEALVNRSITSGEIVRARWSELLEAELTGQSEGSVDTGEELEFWGSDQDADDELDRGATWRVHLTR